MVDATVALYEKNARAYATNSRERGHMSHLHNRFAEYCAAPATILDLGSGPGFDGEILAVRSYRVVCLEPARAQLAVAAGSPALRGHLVQGDAVQLPFRTATFDGVWACASLLHLPRPAVWTALREVNRILAPGGVVFTSMQEGTIANPVIMGPGDSIPGRTYFYYRAHEWLEVIEQCGFELMEQRLKRVSQPYVNAGATGWIETFARKPGQLGTSLPIRAGTWRGTGQRSNRPSR